MIHDVASSHPFFHVGEIVAVALVKLNTSWSAVHLALEQAVVKRCVVVANFSGVRAIGQVATAFIRPVLFSQFTEGCHLGNSYGSRASMLDHIAQYRDPGGQK